MDNHNMIELEEDIKPKIQNKVQQEFMTLQK